MEPNNRKKLPQIPENNIPRQNPNNRVNPNLNNRPNVNQSIPNNRQNPNQSIPNNRQNNNPQNHNMNNKQHINPNDMLHKIKENQSSKKSSNKLIKYSSIALISLLLLGAGGFMIFKALPHTDQKVDNTPKVEAQATNQTSENLEKTPVELPDWARKRYYELSDDDKKNLKEFQSDNFIGYATDPYPSEADGFTSDKTKAYDKDGIPNTYYNSITKESAREQMAMIVNRIINPVFGGWSIYQYPTVWNASDNKPDIINNLLADITTPEYFNTLINENTTPFLFDYKDDDYNGLLSGIKNVKAITKGGEYVVYQSRLIGVIRSNSGKVTYDGYDKINLDVIIDYKTDNNKTVMSKKLHLTLKNMDGLLRIDGGSQNDL